MNTFKGAGGKIYCQKHLPATKHTSTTVQGSLSTASAVNAPKLAKAPGVKKNERMTFAPGELKAVDGSEQN